MSKKYLILTAMLLMATQVVRAQWDVQFSDFTTLKSFYNPAVSGTDGMLNISAAYSLQFSEYDDCPSTMYFGGDLPIYFLSPRHGAGVSLFSDDIGIFKTQKVSIQYAYNMKLGKKGRLAIGIQGGMMNEKIDPGDIKLEDSNDPAFPTSTVDGKAFDMGAGLYFYHPKYWVGVSGQHLLQPSIEMGQTYQIDISRIFYFMGGGNIKIKNSLLSLQPSFMVQTDLQSWREDIQCKATYEFEGRKFYAGIGYSPNTSVTALIGGYFHGIQLGYSYQMYTSGVGYANGAHEIVLNYQTDLDLFKKGRNMHKSVRFL